MAQCNDNQAYFTDWIMLMDNNRTIIWRLILFDWFISRSWQYKWQNKWQSLTSGYHHSDCESIDSTLNSCSILDQPEIHMEQIRASHLLGARRWKGEGEASKRKKRKEKGGQDKGASYASIILKYNQNEGRVWDGLKPDFKLNNSSTNQAVK